MPTSGGYAQGYQRAVQTRALRNEDVAPTGSVFIFYGKNHQSVKLLRWDTDGFVLYQKRLEKGTFEIPKFNEAAGGYRMPWKTFSLIMQGVSLRSARYRKRFKIEV